MMISRFAAILALILSVITYISSQDCSSCTNFVQENEETVKYFYDLKSSPLRVTGSICSDCYITVNPDDLTLLSPACIEEELLSDGFQETFMVNISKLSAKCTCSSKSILQFITNAQYQLQIVINNIADQCGDQLQGEIPPIEEVMLTGLLSCLGGNLLGGTSFSVTYNITDIVLNNILAINSEKTEVDSASIGIVNDAAVTTTCSGTGKALCNCLDKVNFWDYNYKLVQILSACVLGASDYALLDPVVCQN